MRYFIAMLTKAYFSYNIPNPHPKKQQQQKTHTHKNKNTNKNNNNNNNIIINKKHTTKQGGSVDP